MQCPQILRYFYPCFNDCNHCPILLFHSNYCLLIRQDSQRAARVKKQQFSIFFCSTIILLSSSLYPVFEKECMIDLGIQIHVYLSMYLFVDPVDSFLFLRAMCIYDKFLSSSPVVVASHTNTDTAEILANDTDNFVPFYIFIKAYSKAN